MDNIVRKKNVLAATLVIGIFSLLVSFACMLLLYADWLGQPQFLARVPSLKLEEIVTSEQDMDALKHTGLKLSESMENRIQLAEVISSVSRQFERGFEWFVLVWGLVTGVALLYVHYILRRLASNGSL